jgi:hypothetical protein
VAGGVSELDRQTAIGRAVCRQRTRSRRTAWALQVLLRWRLLDDASAALLWPGAGETGALSTLCLAGCALLSGPRVAGLLGSGWQHLTSLSVRLACSISPAPAIWLCLMTRHVYRQGRYLSRSCHLFLNAFAEAGSHAGGIRPESPVPLWEVLR